MQTISIQTMRASKVFNGRMYVETKGDNMPEGFSWSGKRYQSVGGAKRSILSQHKHGYYGAEVWEFIVFETTYTNGTDSYCDVHVYERPTK